MNLKNVIIVLDHPDEPRNIGSTCRAMANSDIKTLRIVGKKSDYDEEKIAILAIHAKYIFDNAEFFNSITEATKDCSAAFGTTRRRGKYRKGKLLLPEELANITDSITGNEKENSGKIAIVFGNERTGLTDEQFAECTDGVTIPSSDEFGSLNLSHAVQIICYNLFRKKSENYKGWTPITLSRLDKSVETILNDLQKIGFFKITGRDDMKMFWRSILSRANLSEGEVKYLEKIFNKTAGLISKNTSI